MNLAEDEKDPEAGSLENLVVRALSWQRALTGPKKVPGQFHRTRFFAHLA